MEKWLQLRRLWLKSTRAGWKVLMLFLEQKLKNLERFEVLNKIWWSRKGVCLRLSCLPSSCAAVLIFSPSVKKQKWFSSPASPRWGLTLCLTDYGKVIVGADAWGPRNVCHNGKSSSAQSSESRLPQEGVSGGQLFSTPLCVASTEMRWTKLDILVNLTISHILVCMNSCSLF